MLATTGRFGRVSSCFQQILPQSHYCLSNVQGTSPLKGDSVIREIYTNWGFIPRPDEVYDFSDLQLPDGFLEQASLEENVLDVANEIVDDMLPGK
jgi:hypothetical protein